MPNIREKKQLGEEENKDCIPKPGWTISLKAYYDKVHELEERLNHERDRRYSEVSSEKEKALKVKEEAEKSALLLAREIQTYKDEKANELREQIASERNLYVSKQELDSAVRELKAMYTASTQWTFQQILTIVGLIVATAVIYFK